MTNKKFIIGVVIISLISFLLYIFMEKNISEKAIVIKKQDNTPFHVQEIDTKKEENAFLYTFVEISKDIFENTYKKEEVELFYIQKNYFYLEPLKLLQGMLDIHGREIILNREAALRLFGSTDIEKETLIHHQKAYDIVGVIEDYSDKAKIFMSHQEKENWQPSYLLVAGEYNDMDIKKLSLALQIDMGAIYIYKGSDVKDFFKQRGYIIALLFFVAIAVLWIEKNIRWFGKLKQEKAYLLEDYYGGEMFRKKPIFFGKASLFLAMSLAAIMFFFISIQAFIGQIIPHLALDISIFLRKDFLESFFKMDPKILTGFYNLSNGLLMISFGYILVFRWKSFIHRKEI